MSQFGMHISIHAPRSIKSKDISNILTSGSVDKIDIVCSGIAAEVKPRKDIIRLAGFNMRLIQYFILVCYIVLINGISSIDIDRRTNMSTS